MCVYEEEEGKRKKDKKKKKKKKEKEKVKVKKEEKKKGKKKKKGWQLEIARVVELERFHLWVDWWWCWRRWRRGVGMVWKPTVEDGITILRR